jgi:hypothetical protein
MNNFFFVKVVDLKPKVLSQPHVLKLLIDLLLAIIASIIASLILIALI